MKTLRLILGDQLNHQHSWYQKKSSDITYLLMEMRQETDYVQHHIQKVYAFFTAMRAFAHQLESSGHQVLYLKINDPSNEQDLAGNIQKIASSNQFESFEYQEPDEYRLDQQLRKLCQDLEIKTSCTSTEHFLTERGDLAQFFKGKKTYLMESFYRDMRKKQNILMGDGEPIHGKWNFDASNRKSFPKNIVLPDRKVRRKVDVDILKQIKEAGIATIGNISEAGFQWATERDQALEGLELFCQKALKSFGDFQDAMHTETVYGYHSLLSFALNAKLLSPREVVARVVREWHHHQEEIPYAAVEGFVRQIIGWREYMRGIYWAKMPDYALMNELNHQESLPDWFWTGKTKMTCLSKAVGQSLDHAYAHHIQRLMVTGNFGLLAGVHPDELDLWYLGIYIDAIEWVEITNTRGMSQYADGGIVGTKPYVSSGNYINKMSNYCNGCYYNVKEKTGEKACPFNSLYWHFHHRHREKLERNPRIGMVYRTWDKMAPEKQKEILQQAEHNLARIEDL